MNTKEKMWEAIVSGSGNTLFLAACTGQRIRDKEREYEAILRSETNQGEKLLLLVREFADILTRLQEGFNADDREFDQELVEDVVLEGMLNVIINDIVQDVLHAQNALVNLYFKVRDREDARAQVKAQSQS